jgi:hypothetical protein
LKLVLCLISTRPVFEEAYSERSYKATYKVADYVNYIKLQSEAAFRNLGQTFAHDHLEV